MAGDCIIKVFLELQVSVILEDGFVLKINYYSHVHSITHWMSSNKRISLLNLSFVYKTGTKTKGWKLSSIQKIYYIKTFVTEN